MVYGVTSSGKVTSCNPRERGFLVGIKVSEYCTSYFYTGESYRIGECVEVHSDPNFGDKIVRVEVIKDG